jgi:hypothetical protein
MIKMGVAITTTGWPAASKRQKNAAMRAAMPLLGRHWHNKMLPEHFETSAPNKYGYERRSRLYMLRKSRERHHQKPMVFTGEMRRTALSFAAIRQTRQKATVRFRTPRALNFSGRIDYPDLRAELTAFSLDEIHKLDRLAERLATRNINQIRTKKTKTI